jgi:stage V sporulation protein G
MFSNPRITPILNNEHVLAVASVKVFETFCLTGIKIVLGKKGDLFIAMPARKDSKGRFNDIFFPINTKVREDLQNFILDAFNKQRTMDKELDTKIQMSYI